jgi:hypothetical protein
MKEAITMESARPEGGDRRSPGEHKRRNMLSVRFSDDELAEVRSAAERIQMATSAWVGKLAVDAAEHRAVPPGWQYREVMTELTRLRSQIIWVGNNVNQIARAINSGIVPGMDLQPVLDRLQEVVDSIEQASEKVRREM